MTGKRIRSRSQRTDRSGHRRSLSEVTDGAARKIQGHHWERLAVVYVRQSTPRQVEEHRETAELQYGLTRRAEQYGWSKDRILVMDEDQGQSGRSAEDRLGFPCDSGLV